MKDKKDEIKDEKYDKKLTIPNVLTVFRMISSVALFGYIAKFGITSPLLITLATLGIGATDAVDGYLARNYGMASRLGSILDPIADKIYNWGLGITLMATGIMPLWPLTIAARDAIVFGVSTYQFKKNSLEMKPTIPAKLKMALQSAGTISTIAFGFGDSGLSLIAPICMVGAIATVIPEVICIKKKYFNKDKSVEETSKINDSIQNDFQEDAIKPIEKSKTLEYNEPTQDIIYDNPKVKKKTLFKKHY